MGPTPSASTASSSMKLAYRSPTLAATVPASGAPAATSSMMARTCSSAVSRSTSKVP